MPSERTAPVREPLSGDEARADHHLAARVLQALEDARNVARIVLAIAIHANHVVVAQLEGQLVAGLHAAAQAQMMRQRQHLGAGARAPSDCVSSVEQSSITSTGTPGTYWWTVADHAGDRALLVEGGHDHQQRVRDHGRESKRGHPSGADANGCAPGGGRPRG